MVRTCRILAIASCVLACAQPTVAQQSIDYASVGGRVTDASGAVVPGARVAATHALTGQTTATVTDREGRFRLPALRVGPYELAVSQPGFTETKHGLTLTAGAAFELPVVLDLGGVRSSVTVTGETTMLDAARSQIAGTVSESEVRTMPLNGRNFLELALLVPGVAPANIGSTQLFPETSAIPGITLSVSSQRNLSNNFIVDGLSANDDAAGLSGITYGVDAVEQFQVVTSGGQAELGRALGGYVNVITRSGTNTLHGTLYDFVRDDGMTAANPLSGVKLPMRQSQYGGSLGGAAIPGRTFYFANVEQRRLDQMGLTTILPASASAVNARLAAAGYRGPLVTTGAYPNPVDSTNVLAKLAHEVSGRDRLELRYSLYDVGAANARGAGGLSAPSASSGLENLDQTLAVSNTLTLTARTVLETRAQVAHGDLQAPPSDPIGPAVSIAGVAAFGTLSTSPAARVNRMYQVVNSVSHQAGAHAIKAGADFLYNDDWIGFPRAARGAYTFSSLAAFQAGAYNNAGFTQTFGETAVAQTNPNLGLYVQDEWKAGGQVTVNLGLRYDLQLLETIDTDRDNVSPRVGVAWSPLASRRMVVRGSAGLFYDRVPLRALANALLSAGNTTDLEELRQVSVSLSPAQAAAPVFPQVLSAVVPSVTLPNLTTMQRNLQNAYSQQAGVEVEQQLGRLTTLSVGYQYLRGLDLLMSVNQNVPACVASGTNNGCRPAPGYANNNQYSSVGESNYHGLHVSFVNRPAPWGHYRVSYTLSRSRNNVGEFFFSSPIDPFDLTKDWGRADNDQRHRLSVSGSARTPAEPPAGLAEWLRNGWQVSASLQAYSAAPFNVTSGVTTIQGTAGRPVVDGAYIERNAGRGNDFFSLNMRVSRAFPVAGRVAIEAVAEGFNLTNRLNPLTRNTTFGPGRYPSEPLPTFNRITAVNEPRTFQLGARLRF